MIKKEMLVDAVICNKNDTALEVSKILRDTQSRHLIVVDEKIKPIGIISTVDLNNRVMAEEKNPKKLKAEEIMTKPILSIDINATPDEAYEKMIERGTFSIPVVEKAKLVGVLEFNSALKEIASKSEK